MVAWSRCVPSLSHRVLLFAVGPAGVGRDADLPVVTSAAVLVEVIHPRINDAALKWTLSRLRVEPVTQGLAQSAAALLRGAGLHGHEYAIDAMLCATALAQPGRVTILTSDVEDVEMLTADHARVAAEKV